MLTRDGDHRVSLLSVDGNKVEDTKKFMVGGFRPYSIVVGPKGDYAVFGNQGGGQGDVDQINVVDLKSNPPRVVDAISVGQTPEGVSMSPDGSHVAVILHNGSPRAKNHPADTSSAFINAHLKRYEAAAAELEVAVALDPDHMPTLYEFGHLAAISGVDLPEGQRSLQKYLAHTPKPREPSCDEARVWLVKIQEREGTRTR